MQGALIDVMGRVSASKFTSFLEELRASRSRTVTLGVAGAAPDADAAELSNLHDAVRGRPLLCACLFASPCRSR